MARTPAGIRALRFRWAQLLTPDVHPLMCVLSSNDSANLFPCGRGFTLNRPPFRTFSVAPRVLATAVCAAITLHAFPSTAQDPAREPASGIVAAESFHLEGSIGLWRPAAGFVIATDAPGIPGTRVDARRDLGLSRHGLPQFQLVIRPAKKHKIRFQYIPITYDSTATLPRDIFVNGTRYDQGGDVQSSLDWQSYRLGYEYDFLVRRWGFAGAIGELKQTNFTLTVHGTSGDQAPRTTLPTPAAGGIVRVYPIERLSFTAEFTGIRVPYRSDRRYGGYYAELDAYTTANFTRSVGMHFGYRSFWIDHLGARNSATLPLHGPYLGATVRF